jgi:hypothetical protein
MPGLRLRMVLAGLIALGSQGACDRQSTEQQRATIGPASATSATTAPARLRTAFPPVAVLPAARSNATGFYLEAPACVVPVGGVSFPFTVPALGRGVVRVFFEGLVRARTAPHGGSVVQASLWTPAGVRVDTGRTECAEAILPVADLSHCTLRLHAPVEPGQARSLVLVLDSTLGASTTVDVSLAAFDPGE